MWNKVVKIKERILGKSNIRVSPLGMGCWAIGGTIIDQEGKPTGYGIIDDKESIKAIQCAIDLGINFFDTADMYGAGHSEEILGKAIQGYRDDIVIATKFGNTFDSENKRKIGTNITPKYIKMACEASLNRLGTDFIDCLLYTSPSPRDRS